MFNMHFEGMHDGLPFLGQHTSWSSLCPGRVGNAAGSVRFLFVHRSMCGNFAGVPLMDHPGDYLHQIVLSNHTVLCTYFGAAQINHGCYSHCAITLLETLAVAEGNCRIGDHCCIIHTILPQLTQYHHATIQRGRKPKHSLCGPLDELLPKNWVLSCNVLVGNVGQLKGGTMTSEKATIQWRNHWHDKVAAYPDVGHNWTWK